MNWLQYYDTKKSIHRYQKLHFSSFDKKMKTFKMRIFTIVPCCFQNIAKSYMTCNLFSRKKFLEYDISP